MRKLSSRIVVRIAVPALVAGMLLVGGMAWLQYDEVRRRGVQTLDRYATLLSRLTLGSINDAMLNDHRETLHGQLTRVAALEHVHRVWIVDKGGHIAHSSDAADEGRKVEPSDPTCRVCHQPGVKPETRARTVHFTSETGERQFRTVEPIRAARRCLRCHEEPEGTVLGVLITDLEEPALTGDLQRGAERAVWLVGSAFLVLIGLVILVVRLVVVSRVHSLRRLLELLRSGARDVMPGGAVGDEFDELDRQVRALTLDLDDRLAITRAAGALGGVLARHPGAVLLLDDAGVVVAANPPALADAAEPLVGRPQPELDPLREIAGGQGWALAEDPSGPLIVRLVGGEGPPMGYLAVCPEAEALDDDSGDEGPSDEGSPPEPPAPEWRMYAVALASAIAPDPGAWKGVLQFDRRLVAGRRLVDALARSAETIRAAWGPQSLRALVEAVRGDAQRQAPDLEWRLLLEPDREVQGSGALLRGMVRRLLRAVVSQAVPGGQVVIFSQGGLGLGGANQAFLGAWTGAQEGSPVPVDPPGLPRLTQWVARVHGGGLEVDSAFDIAELFAARDVLAPPVSTGVLFVVQLPAI